MRFRIINLALVMMLFSCGSDDDSSSDTMSEVADSEESVDGIEVIDNEDDDNMVVDDMNDEEMDDEDSEVDVVFVNYDDDVAPIINTYCLQCHGSPVANGAPQSAVFNSYEKVSEVADFIRDRINGVFGIMPPESVGGQLDQELIDTVDQWIEDGLLEN